MHLPPTLSILTTSLSLAKAHTSNTTINFDDILTPHGMTTLPAPYNHLTFTSSSAFNPGSPSLAHLITPRDLNCAVSGPNALIASRPTRSSPPASITANATSLSAAGLRSDFTLRSMWLKPMDAPPGGCTVFVRGEGGGGVLEWNVTFPYGFHDMFAFRAREFTGREWRVGKVEVWAAFGEGELDWEVCVDDVVVGFAEVEGMEMGRQRVLGG